MTPRNTEYTKYDPPGAQVSDDTLSQKYLLYTPPSRQKRKIQVRKAGIHKRIFSKFMLLEMTFITVLYSNSYYCLRNILLLKFTYLGITLIIVLAHQSYMGARGSCRYQIFGWLLMSHKKFPISKVFLELIHGIPLSFFCIVHKSCLCTKF